MTRDDTNTPGQPNPRTPRPRRVRRPLSMRPVAFLVVFGLSTVLAVLLYDNFRNPASRALQQDPGLESLVVPEFTLTAQDGRAISRDDLLGHLTVIDFFFSNCPAICPALTRSMKRIHDAVGDRGVRLLSISVDPINDTPAALREHAREVGADPRVWTFATGRDFEEIAAISEGGLKLGLSKDSARRIPLPGGDDMEWIDHSGKLILLDQDARVIGLASGLDEREVDQLISRLLRATSRR
ncbi:MAG: SCO family protein [Phycisphaeraceae bacterium]|nr:SCO family protein [Phycisphaeraceae bacterium]